MATVYNTPVDKLRDLLSESTTWQEWCEVDEQDDPVAAALERIYRFEVPDNATYPRAHVDFGDDFRREAIATGTGFTYRVRGTLYIMIETVLPLELTDKTNQAFVWLLDKVGRVQRDMELLSGRSDRIAVAAFSPGNGMPALAEKSAAGRRRAAMVIECELQ